MVNIRRWEAANYHNTPVLHTIRRNHRLPLEWFYRPNTYRNRINLWVMSAAMLDIARYLNTVDNSGRPLRGTCAEREMVNELGPLIKLNYRREMENFRRRFKEETNNFESPDLIKEALYTVIMTLPKNRIGSVSPFYLLGKATNQALLTQTHTVK